MFWSADKKILWPHVCRTLTCISSRSSGSVFDISVFILTLQNIAVVKWESTVCINLVRPSMGFHTTFYWLYQVDLPDVCLKHIFVFFFFFKSSHSKHKSLLKNVYLLMNPLFFLATYLSSSQVTGVRLMRTIYTSVSTCALPLLTREKDIVFLIVHCWQAQDRAHWAVKVDIWYTTTQLTWWWSCTESLLHTCSFLVLPVTCLGPKLKSNHGKKVGDRWDE